MNKAVANSKNIVTLDQIAARMKKSTSEIVTRDNAEAFIVAMNKTHRVETEKSIVNQASIQTGTTTDVSTVET